MALSSSATMLPGTAGYLIHVQQVNVPRPELFPES